jgi:hypothetical protein
MDWKKVKTKADEAHFQAQRTITLALMFGGSIMALFSLVPIGDANTLTGAEILKCLTYFVIAVISAKLYLHIMKNKYPNYPYHHKGPPNFPSI